ncbi:hypothetical protein PAXINDRAFT_101298 [Paxillus involutus ATCC 200175]|uniref:F-box domain-containing protein n=1 Tax=Paxillus involutus ATCC 200175 TaxID=664439 RepID=A0A0C9TP35_PAXIN|nr:hypothetical protein PAXINDRAFT_101298 [Paxillus involutus ATCC 200175]
MCFPQDILDFSEEIQSFGFTIVKFAKVPSVQDWERPSVYATRIRTMKNMSHICLATMHNKLHQSVLRILLESCPSIPLLPNLRHLEYHCINGGFNTYVASATYVAESLLMLFSPNLLQSLQFGCCDRLESHERHTFRTHLPKRCAQIEFLGVSLLDISEYIATFASLRYLKSLDLVVEYPGGVFPSFLNLPNVFPSLIDLSAMCQSTIAAVDIFKAIDSTKLRGIDLRLPCEVNITHLRELFAIMVSRPTWKQSMRSISLSIRACGMAVDDVQRLFAFNHLRHLELVNTGLVLDDHVLNDMATTWPMLERLVVTNADYGIPSNATLNGLVPFPKHCPHIATLELRLDARNVPAPVNATDASRDESREGETTPVRLSIHVASEIHDSTNVASFLLNLFPRITLSLAEDYAESQEAVLWRRVVDIINETHGLPHARRPRNWR